MRRGERHPPLEAHATRASAARFRDAPIDPTAAKIGSSIPPRATLVGDQYRDHAPRVFAAVVATAWRVPSMHAESALLDLSAPLATLCLHPILRMLSPAGGSIRCAGLVNCQRVSSCESVGSFR